MFEILLNFVNILISGVHKKILWIHDKITNIYYQIYTVINTKIRTNSMQFCNVKKWQEE